MYLVNGRLYTGSAPCFYCGKNVGRDERRIQWTGHEADILLHIPCALRLVAGFTADLVTAENAPLEQVVEPGQGLAYITQLAANERARAKAVIERTGGKVIEPGEKR
jgi:hypothetical protein